MSNPFDFNNNGEFDLIDFLVASELDPNNPINVSQDDEDYGMEMALNDTGADADVFDMDDGDYENWLDSLD